MATGSISDERTIQSSIKNCDNASMTNYALFLNGVNATHDALEQYDPLKTGYGRLFCVSGPLFVELGIPNKWKRYKHMLEYANTAVSGINDMSMEFNQITGGYAGKQFEIPSHITDGTNSFSVKLYEFSGSPIRELNHYWLNGVSDINSGLCHYNGVDCAKCQANQTAEFIYVSTDNTGEAVEYACLFANCMPKTIKNDHWNYSSNEHQLVEVDLEFSCTKYESIQINAVAAALLKKFRVFTNSMNFYSGYSVNDPELGGSATGFTYDPTTGQIGNDGRQSGNGSEDIMTSELNTPRPAPVFQATDRTGTIQWED